MKLVPDWRKAWKWFSMQSMVLAGAMQAAWLAMSSDLQARVPADVVDALTVAVLALGIIGRLVKQGGGE